MLDHPYIAWRFPGNGVPPNQPILKRIFHCEPSIVGYPQFRKPPYQTTKTQQETIHQRSTRLNHVKPPINHIEAVFFCWPVGAGAGGALSYSYRPADLTLAVVKWRGNICGKWIKWIGMGHIVKSLLFFFPFLDYQ